MKSRMVVSGLLVLALLGSAAPTLGAAPGTGVPTLSLRRTSAETIAYKFGKRAPRFDIPVYLQAKDAPLDLRVRRASYAAPLTLHQVLHTSADNQWVELDAEHLNGWRGLRDFTRIKVRDSNGHLILSTTETFCPNSWDRQRVDDSGPATPLYPYGCYGRDRSFLKGMVWGIDQSWAVPLAGGVKLDADPGTYEVTVRITRPYRELFGIEDSAAVQTLQVEVRNFGNRQRNLRVQSEDAEGEPSAGVPALDDPGASVDPSLLPDLESAPAFRIRVANNRRGKSRLEFASMVWTGGGSSLVVEGFRREDEDIMDAYQYFYDGDTALGRTPVGTFEYDRRDGHFHWHIQQFATYRMRSVDSDEVVRSSKQSFCLVPTDAVDLSLDNASWNSERTGLNTACGGPDAMWIREVLPLGWGDTYSQVGGQAFNITQLPNGKYWVEVEANPLGLLYEQNTDNNLVRRKVVLKGRLGARRVVVRPWQGIDF